MKEQANAKGVLLKIWRILWPPMIAIVMGLIVGAVVIVIAGENPLFVYSQMFQKSFFNFFYLLQTLTRAVPITVCSIAIIVAWRAGYINLGVEGQMLVGGFISSVVAIYCPGPEPLVFALAIVAGMAGGAAYALFAAFIFDKFNVSIVISTLMMNYIANYITTYFISFPMRDASSNVAIQTVEISSGMRLPAIFQGHTFNIGFIITVIIVIAVMFVTRKTNFGYESKMTGLNPVFARYGGVKRTRMMYATMALSGALAASAGMLEIYGVKFRFLEGMFTSTSYAWSGLMSGLISSLHPVGAFVVSIFLAGLQVGGQAIQRTTNIPLQVATLIQSTITLFVSVKLFSQYRRAKKNKKSTPAAPVAKEGEA